MAGFALLVQEEGGKYGHKEKRVVRDRNRLKEGEAEEEPSRQQLLSKEGAEGFSKRDIKLHSSNPAKRNFLL